MQAIFFTQEQKESFDQYFVDYKQKFEWKRWEFFRVRTGYILPKEIVNDEELMKVIPQGFLDSCIMREFTNDDKIIINDLPK